MGTEFLAFLTEQLALTWSRFQHAILIPLPIAAIVMLLAYLAMRRQGLRSWRDFREFVFPSRLRHARTIKMDAVALVLSYGLVGPIAKVLALVISAELFATLLSNLAAPPIVLVEPGLVIALQLLTAVAFGEFGYWAGHYLHHKVPFLWPLHKVHHSSEALMFISGYRSHPMETLLTMPLFSLVLPAVGVGSALYFTGGHLHPIVVSAFVVHETALSTLSILHHSPARISFGRLDWIFNSPAMHHIHHSAELVHRDKNFGMGLSIFDWLFGTAYLPEEGEQFRFGADENEIGERNPHLTWRGFFLGPVMDFGRGLLALVRPGPRHARRAIGPALVVVLCAGAIVNSATLLGAEKDTAQSGPRMQPQAIST